MLIVNTGTTPTIADFIAKVRSDLFDAGQRLGDVERWSDSDLTRALDRSNDRYSSVAPNLKQTTVPTVTGSRLYALPSDAWWADAAEYPYGYWPKWYQPVDELISPLLPNPPANAGSAALSAGGSLSAGAYSWLASFLSPGGGETLAVALASATATAGQRATLNSIPVGPYGVTDRNIYRTTAGGSTFYLVGNVGDNSSSLYTDSSSDATISANAQQPAANSTQGIRLYELQISEALLPSPTNSNGQDPNYGYIGLRYAAKHELDSGGTTIPERHWDVLCTGAEMYAIMAYLTPTADNFHWVDGQFRDQVDDHWVPLAWLQVAQNLSNDLKARLVEIKNEENAGVAAISQWGDKPERWDRL